MAKQEHEYGAEILYSDGECIMGAPEGSPRQLKMEASNRWSRVLKPLKERSEAICKKVADAVKAETKKQPKRKRRSKKKPL